MPRPALEEPARGQHNHCGVAATARSQIDDHCVGGAKLLHRGCERVARELGTKEALQFEIADVPIEHTPSADAKALGLRFATKAREVLLCLHDVLSRIGNSLGTELELDMTIGSGGGQVSAQHFCE